MNTASSQYTWRLAGPAVAVLLLLTFGVYHETLLYLIGLWNQLETGEYAHGYLVLAISVYLVLRQRRALAALSALSKRLGVAGGAGGKPAVDAGGSRRCPDAADRRPVAAGAGSGVDRAW